MALNIKSNKADRLARELARRTGETLTEAVTRALQERLDRARRLTPNTSLADELDEIALHCANLPELDARSADEVIGYDERGLLQ